MDQQELGNTLGRIEAGVKGNGERLDRHNKVHETLDQRALETQKDVAVIKGKAAIIALLISLVVGIIGLIIRFWK